MRNVHSWRDVCCWEKNSDGYGVYDTQCKNVVEITEGGPVKNNFKFCPYCGKEIEIVVPKNDSLDEVAGTYIVELPCKPGDTVYYVFSRQGVVPEKIRRLQFNKDGWFIVAHRGATSVEDIGRTIFLNEEDANKAYAERYPSAL